ncbi:hypothetical protein [Vibrio coralliirubri]|uniref:hypothetical protein n=1 Tax=Vibrio coralliirubri TaxID=1516159 RepID=UPI0012F7556F|nr:hypothetical protein [Vibrio coralliirubri]
MHLVKPIIDNYNHSPFYFMWYQMKRIIPFAVISGLLSACGTSTYTHSFVWEDELKQKNVCYTSLSIINGDLLTKGNPETIRVGVYANSRISLESIHYRVYHSDQSENVKEVLVRVGNNEIIKMSDFTQDDTKFTTHKQEEFKDQLLEADSMVVRLNYYDGYTITLSANISDFKNDWSEMLVKCQAT